MAVKFFGIEIMQAEGKIETHFCKWCQYRVVDEKGAECSVCQQIKFRHFKSDRGFPWLRVLVAAIVFIVFWTIFSLLQK